MGFLIISGSLEQGLVYGIMALGVYLTFRVLQFPDLTVNGSFPLGAAVAAALIVKGVPPLMATAVAMGAGLLAGSITGILHTKLRVTGILAGILTMTGLYSVNLRIMGRANIPLLRQTTVFTQLEELLPTVPGLTLVFFLILAFLLKLLLDAFLSTSYGMAMRAVGDNPDMIRSLGVDTQAMTITGLALSNGLVALSGALVAQYQGFADIGMGIGTIVVGLASVILGNGIIRARGVFGATMGVLIGAIVYRLAIFFALRLGLAPTDLRIVTAVLVMAALSTPTLKQMWQERTHAKRLAAENARLWRGGRPSHARDSAPM
jgi:putative ABC transport system permease protein